MAGRCPECDAEIESDALDEFDVDIGDQLFCTVCAASLVVSKVNPVELLVEATSQPVDQDDHD